MEARGTSNQVTFLVVLPHYNHSKTLRAVAKQCRAVWPHVLVVDDGSNESPETYLQGLDVSFLRQTPNQGKGTAIMTGAAWAQEHGFSHIITIDAGAYANLMSVYRSALGLDVNSAIFGYMCKRVKPCKIFKVATGAIRSIYSTRYVFGANVTPLKWKL